MTCDCCAAPVTRDTAHVYETFTDGVVGRFCEQCCPRCFAVPLFETVSIP